MSYSVLSRLLGALVLKKQWSEQDAIMMRSFITLHFKAIAFILKKVPTVGLSNCSHFQHTNSNTTASIFQACLIGGLKSITDAPAVGFSFKALYHIAKR